MTDLLPPPEAVVPPARRPSAPKAAAKAVVHAAATLAVLPALVAYRAGAAVLGRDRALEGASQAFALLPGLTGVFLRRAFLARVLANCDPSAEVGFGTLLSQAGAMIDADVYVGPRCFLGLVHLQRGALLGGGVHVPSGGRTHLTDDPAAPIWQQGGERRRVTVGEGAWIGAAAVVMADVGRGTIVGAGSVVTKPLPDYVVAAGAPARVIRDRFPRHEFAHGSGTQDRGASG